MHTEDQAAGCLLGLALGDAYGAPREGGLLERLLWAFIGRTPAGHRRWTDDTAMALAMAESIAAHGRVWQDDLARRFAADYAWSRGYGAGTARVLKSLRRGVDWRVASRAGFPEGSYGNGAAMRSPVLALAFRGEALLQAALDAAVVTHGHELAIAGARTIAVAVELSLRRLPAPSAIRSLQERVPHPELASKLGMAAGWLGAGIPMPPQQVRAELGCSVRATDSCVTAAYLGLAHEAHSFEELLSAVAQVGGDVDTIGAMAGAIWGARHGAVALPGNLREKLEAESRILAAAKALHARFAGV